MAAVVKVAERIRGIVVESRGRGEARLPSERGLAERLGVSRATVAKALAGLAREGLVVRRHGSGTYVLDRPARTALCLGVGLRHVIHKSGPHFGVLLGALSRHAEARGVHLQIFEGLAGQFRADPVANPISRAISSGLLDGVILISRMPMDVAGRLCEQTRVAMLNNTAGGSGVASVACDHYRAGFLAAGYLARRGHTRIAYATDSLNHPQAPANISGFRSALECKGLPFGDEDAWVLPANSDSFDRVFKEKLARSAHTAIFVRHDFLAARLIRALTRAGRRVPGDVSVMGMGDYPWGFQSPVPLTTVDNRFDEMCRIAVEWFCDGWPEGQPPQVFLDPRIVERDSVAEACAATQEKGGQR